MIGYEFAHHNALEDAKAAGQIVITAMRETGADIGGLIERLKRPIVSATPIRRDGLPDGPLADEVVVFTGTLEIPRREAADLAASVGCDVSSSVTKKTTILVVGDVDVARLAGHKKSSKHRKAETLIADGQNLRIIRETDFRKLVAPD